MFTQKVRLSLFTTIMAGMLAVTGCGNQSPTSTAGDAPKAETSAAQEQVLNIGLKSDPPSLDPAQSSATVDRMVQNSIYDKLFDLDKDGQIVPVLAESYEVSEDGKTYTLKLRQGVKFQDGTDFNAEAVKFNLDRYKEEGSKRAGEVKIINQVTVVDPLTVKIELSQPFAPFISVLTDRSGMMASPDAVKKYGKDYLNHPVGTGPFAFVEHVTGDHVTLKKNEQYWNGDVKLDQVNFKVFTNGTAAVQNLRSGVLDMIDSVPTKEIKGLQDSGFNVVTEPSMGYFGFYLNMSKEPFTNKFLRQAVDRAIDREAVVKVLMEGYAEPANSPFSPGNLAYGDFDKASKPNPEEIKSLLQQGGKPEGFTFKLQIGTSPKEEQFGAIVQGMLKPYNINVELEKVEFGALLDNEVSGNFQALALGWSGRPDPDQNFYDFVVKGAPYNVSRFDNDKLGELALQARVELDPAKRKQLYGQAMEIMHDEAGYVYVYHEANLIAMSKNVAGFTYVPDGIIRTATIEKK
ncbi:ABC transporter substrate-binding protein [Brevibacillus fulvus]|uniref:Peptide/nickel transport system substrate-binding protein n=1 Tax=Brevibacillus fulvus TaxID=1125967 RepID=A0A938Y0U8_9BACL|nr:ABC transporter substrate-binding protein [Brevibacillus fulvus]MBM7591118.1 peptide/nickel transport system substrate-binding protein [Brevibacillus fulvus]